MRILIILACALMSAAGGASAAWFMRDDNTNNGAAVVEEADRSPDLYGFVELQNQFVIPLTQGNDVSGLVAVSLAIEGEKGKEETILHAEPLLRDAFLRVLFEHARANGFRGDFTNSSSMSELRNRLTSAAQDLLGTGVSGVLITSVTRQDF